MERVEGRGASLVRRIHWPRLVGMCLGFVCVGAVFHTLGAPAWLWVLLAGHAFVWPQLARYHGLHSANPYQAVSRHLLVDVVCAGFWVAAMQFNALASVIVLVMPSMNNMAVGGPRLFATGLAGALAGAAAGAWLLGGEVRLQSTPFEIYAALPMLLLYPLVLGYECFRLSRRLARHKRELAQLSIQDGLTGLYNRGHWERVLRQRFEQPRVNGHQPALMLIDLDHFKHINDTHGHVAGDAALRYVASCLRACAGPADICARYGGDEFVVLVDDADEHALRDLVDRVQGVLDTPDTLSWLTGDLGISAGACLLDEGLESSDAWIQCADAAMYAAKSDGRRRFVLAGNRAAGAAAAPSGAWPSATATT